jgi:peptidoglycan/LPS O-acetylase OafA/YrhL
MVLFQALQNDYVQCFFQGHVITLTFFIMSGFLMTYNSQILRETRTFNWAMLPKGILVRWLR